jgi:hypothetical protein
MKMLVTLSKRQVEMLKAGGLLNSMSLKNKEN